MLAALLLQLSLAADPNPRVLYEQKCLYCHSDELTRHPEWSAWQWRTAIGRMRAKSPLFITRSDAHVLTRYVAATLRLSWPVAPAAPAAPVEKPTVAPGPALPPAEPPRVESPAVEVKEEVSAADEHLEQEGRELMERRCSKCHTLARVYGKLDSLQRSMSTLARMRAKTGSGITHDDAERLEQFLRSQLEQPRQ